MLRVFHITLTGAAKRWVERLPPGTVNSWDLFKKAFIQRYCPPLKTAKQLEEIRNFKQEGPIPGMTPAQALTAIQTVADHSQNQGHDIKKLKDNMHAIQVGCQTCGGAHLDKECPLNEEVKSVEEVKYSEFGRSSPFSIGAKYRVGPPGYYTRIDNRPSFGEKMPSWEELMNNHLEESTRRRVMTSNNVYSYCKELLLNCLYLRIAVIME
ncbi:zinc knuckle CX2CX4HX4C containing protein [Tanacetum coccineum]